MSSPYRRAGDLGKVSRSACSVGRSYGTTLGTTASLAADVEATKMEPDVTGHNYLYKMSQHEFLDRMGIDVPIGEVLIEVNATRFGGKINITVQTADEDY